MTARPASTPAGVLGSGVPAVIAHGGGNTHRLAIEAAALGADYLEADLWTHGTRLEARHERAIYPLPVLVEKWYMRFAPRQPFGLSELLMAVPTGIPLFLDLKNGGSRAAELTRRALESSGKEVEVVASSQVWSVLRHVAEVLPRVPTYYSIDVRSKLDLFLSVSDRDVRPRGVSCQHRLLTEQNVRRLKEQGLLVVAWTVDDVERARELIGWGVDGITTHRIAEVRRLVDGCGGGDS